MSVQVGLSYNGNFLTFPASYICPPGTDKYVYNQSALPIENLAITTDQGSTEVAETILSPSSSDLTSDEALTLKLQLTPVGRKSDVFITLQAMNAIYVSFESGGVVPAIQVKP